MRLLTLWIVLVVISFSAMHDFLLSVAGSNPSSLAYHASPDEPMGKYAPMDKVHGLLHFIAIFPISNTLPLHWVKMVLPNDLILPTAHPVIECSYKPPIA